MHGTARAFFFALLKMLVLRNKQVRKSSQHSQYGQCILNHERQIKVNQAPMYAKAAMYNI
jgi:hypothetical protein